VALKRAGYVARSQ